MSRNPPPFAWLVAATLTLAFMLFSAPARAAEADLYCLTGTTSTGAPNWQPASSTNPCPTGSSGAGSTTPTTQSAATVTTGGTFQQALAANTSRTGCLIDNTSTHTAYVYWLASGTASLTNAVQIAAGQVFVCANASGGVVKTAIQWTTGTTGDPFVITENQ